MWCRKKIRLKKFTEASFSNLVSYFLYAKAKPILWAKLDMRILQRMALKSASSFTAADVLFKRKTLPSGLPKEEQG